MENEKNPSNPGDTNFDEAYFQLWKTYEDVAMHFNVLIIRLRTQSIGGLAALATVLGILLKSDSSANGGFNYGLAMLAVLFLMLCWIAVWVLDLRYYNRLLEGSVNAILELEKNKESFFGKREINLSTNIERAFKVRFPHEFTNVELKRGEKKKDFINGRNWFYVIVFCALLIVLGTLVLCWRVCVREETLTEAHQKPTRYVSLREN